MTTPNAGDMLLPCPFCGNERIEILSTNECPEHPLSIYCDVCGIDNGHWLESCGASMIKHWNRRSQFIMPSMETIKKMCAAMIGFDSVSDWELACENEQAISQQIKDMRAALSVLQEKI